MCSAFAEPESLLTQPPHEGRPVHGHSGFTAWCDRQSLSDIATMLEAPTHSAAEEVWSRHRSLSAKLSADEVMLVFADGAEAIRAAIDLSTKAGECLACCCLSVGIGINGWVLIQGVIGSRKKRAYEVAMRRSGKRCEPDL